VCQKEAVAISVSISAGGTPLQGYCPACNVVFRALSPGNIAVKGYTTATCTVLTPELAIVAAYLTQIMRCVGSNRKVGDQ
jgi:hypothetical protein